MSEFYELQADTDEFSGALPNLFGAIGAGATAEVVMTSNRAKVGDLVTVTPASDPGAGLIWTGYVATPCTITIRCANVTAAPITPDALASWKVRVHHSRTGVTSLAPHA